MSREPRVHVDAICTGCKQIRVKTVAESDAGGSFKHVCHACQRVTWWNSIATLDGLNRETESVSQRAATDGGSQ